MTIAKINLLIKHRGTQTLLVLGIYALMAKYIPSSIHQGLYTLSLIIKDLLIWVMPLTVGFFISHTIKNFEKRAGLFIVALIFFEAISNMMSVWYAYGSANMVADFLPAVKATNLSGTILPLWHLPILKPNWWSAQNGVIIGILLGLVGGFTKNNLLSQFIVMGKQTMEWILTKLFSPLIPLFVLGFAAQIYQTKLLNQVFAFYGSLVLYLILFLAMYIIFLVALGAGKSLKLISYNLKNLLPAGGIAFTSGCSLSTMPWTIQGASKTLQNPDLAQAIIPATTNIQQIGDCIANAFLCFLIYRHFYGVNPDAVIWASFSVVFVLARFTTAAILGGAIFIMLPIYESYLNFNSEMIAIIVALNVILDPLITSSNVLANGASCRVFERVWLSVLSCVSRTKQDKPSPLC